MSLLSLCDVTIIRLVCVTYMDAKYQNIIKAQDVDIILKQQQ
jgi:hypothetical protein